MYTPKPIDTTYVSLPEAIQDLVERLAESTHDNWALGRINSGWTYGPVRNDELKQTPCLVPYCELSDEEKSYDRVTAMETLKAVYALSFKLVPLPVCANFGRGDRCCDKEEGADPNHCRFESPEQLCKYLGNKPYDVVGHKKPRHYEGPGPEVQTCGYCKAPVAHNQVMCPDCRAHCMSGDRWSYTRNIWVSNPDIDTDFENGIC